MNLSVSLSVAIASHSLPIGMTKYTMACRNSLLILYILYIFFFFHPIQARWKMGVSLDTLFYSMMLKVPQTWGNIWRSCTRGSHFYSVLISDEHMQPSSKLVLPLHHRLNTFCVDKLYRSCQLHFPSSPVNLRTNLSSQTLCSRCVAVKLTPQVCNEPPASLNS